MKNAFLKVSLAIFLSLVSVRVCAQPYYFQKSTAPYSPLTNPISVNNGSVWSGFQTFPVPIGFDFDFMNSAFNSLDFESTGRLIFDSDHFYFADLFTTLGLQDKGGTTSLSPIDYQLEGTTPNRVFKLQVSNATLSGDPASTVNFQVWLYESMSRIELHTGPVTITNPGIALSQGLLSGVFHISGWTPLTYNYGLLIYGNALNPMDSTFSGSMTNTSPLILNNAPTESTVHIYTTDTTTVGIDQELLPDHILYPNPASNVLRLVGAPEGSNWVVFDLQGRKIIDLKGGEQVNVDQLVPGRFILEVRHQPTGFRKFFPFVKQ